MDTLKKVFSEIDFHLNAVEKSLSISYGDNQIVFRISEDGRLRFETNLSLEGPLMP